MDRGHRINQLLTFVSIILFGSIVLSAEILNLSLFPINPDFKIEQIASAGDYILFKHLNKNLIDIDADGRIYGDLAQSWKIEKDHTSFTFRIKDTAKFSDNSKVTSNDIKSSFDDLVQKKGGIHFDFSNVKKINILSDSEINIELKQSTPRFLRNLTHPEFGIRKTESIKNSNYDITSGCYAILSILKSEIILKKNPLCQDSQNTFKKVSFSFVIPNEQKESALNKKKDFYISLMPEKDLKEVISTNNYKTESPHIGFTFWLATNTTKKIFSKKENREGIFMLFNENFRTESTNEIEIARQLYLPNGPGRLSPVEIESIVSKKSSSIETLKKYEISVLLPKTFEFNKNILSILKSAFKTVNAEYYNNQKEFIEMNPKKFDLFLTNNDFSSVDLYENISVTFNPIRPLIFENKKIKNILDIMKKTSDEDTMYQQYKKIAEIILSDSLIIPLVHKKVIFLRKNEIDISSWSKIYPEISAWKIRNNNE